MNSWIDSFISTGIDNVMNIWWEMSLMRSRFYASDRSDIRLHNQWKDTSQSDLENEETDEISSRRSLMGTSQVICTVYSPI